MSGLQYPFQPEFENSDYADYYWIESGMSALFSNCLGFLKKVVLGKHIARMICVVMVYTDPSPYDILV